MNIYRGSPLALNVRMIESLSAPTRRTEAMLWTQPCRLHSPMHSSFNRGLASFWDICIIKCMEV